MKKYFLFVIVCLFTVLIISCQPNRSEPFPKLKGIKNFSKYDNLGVGSIVNDTRVLSEETYSEKFLIGYQKNGYTEKVTFLDEKGNDISNSFPVINYNVYGNYLFLSFYNRQTSGFKYFCTYLPTGDMFEVEGFQGLATDSPNDMTIEINNAVYDVYNGVKKTFFHDGQLFIEQLASPYVTGFDYIFVDKYGNVFSSDWNSGHLLTSKGKLKNLPTTMKYRKGMNNIVYYENNGEKGFFDENGEQQIITEGDFYPDFIVYDLFSSSCRFYDIIEYIDGSSHYFFSFEKAGFNFFRESLFKIEFAENDKYSETIIKNLEKELYPNGNRNDLEVRGYALLEKYLYVMASDKFIKIDMTNGNIFTVSDDYYEYKSFEFMEDKFRITAIDENMNSVVFLLDSFGNKTVIESKSLTIKSIHLFPCNK